MNEITLTADTEDKKQSSKQHRTLWDRFIVIITNSFKLKKISSFTASNSELPLFNIFHSLQKDNKFRRKSI